MTPNDRDADEGDAIPRLDVTNEETNEPQQSTENAKKTHESGEARSVPKEQPSNEDVEPNDVWVGSQIDAGENKEKGCNEEDQRGQSGDSTPAGPAADDSKPETTEAQSEQLGGLNPIHQVDEAPYSIFTHNEKRIIILFAGICSFFSPISGQIYFPALNAISKDLGVSHSLINLTITTYLIMQGLAPAFVGGLADESGRRSAYVVCFIIYAIANIGLGIQSDYPALMVLRCIQSAGSSGTVALAYAVAADVVTSQERGIYVSYMSIAPQAGPSLGPIIGGLLAQYLGWHSIFWFLLIVTGVVSAPVLLFFPETCRKVVGDGSIPPPKWDRCYMNRKIEKRLISEGKEIQYDKRDELARQRKFRFPNPFEAVRILFTKEAGFALFYVGIVCLGYYATIALLPSQFGSVYGFNEIQIALCYLPLGVGSAAAAFVRGRMIDTRYKFHAKRLDMPLTFNRRVDLSNFPIERARLEVALPTLALGSVCMIGFGWMIQYEVNLAGPIIFLLVIGFCVSASINTVSVLLVDLYPGKPGTATAANNLCRCWLGAASTAFVSPLIDKIGIGWTTTFFGGLVIVFSPVLFYIMANGPKWRRATKEKKEREEAEKRAKADAEA